MSRRHGDGAAASAEPAVVRPERALVPPQRLAVGGGFVTIDGVRYARIVDVDAMPPFLMSIVSDSDVWLFVGSNGAFTAGRKDPDHGLFPSQTVDKILRDPNASGVHSTFLVSRDGRTLLWEPWRDVPGTRRRHRNLYKRVDGTAVLFEEIDEELGLRFRWSLAACEAFGVVRHAVLEDITGVGAEVRYLDGWHDLIPPGVSRDLYARLSYLAVAYMRHERLPASRLALYTLNTRVSDRPEPSESLRAAVAWAVGHPAPRVQLGAAGAEAFRRGAELDDQAEVRGVAGAYLAAGEVSLPPGGSFEWYTVADTGLDHAEVLELAHRLDVPDAALQADVERALEADRASVQRRLAGADATQVTADEAATANHVANVLFNIMRGGTFEHGYDIPVPDLRAYLLDQNRVIAERHLAWLAELPDRLGREELVVAAQAQGDPQLTRLVRGYLPLTFSRRHGDPSRPWNWYTIRVHDGDDLVYGYEGNWRDIFQNWEALGISYPGYLSHFVTVFLDASTADGYNPYRITRAGIDWEVEDPEDPWSHIGYWGDHQVVYLLKLLEAYERHEPGALRAGLDERRYSYADVPYRIGTFEAIAADPKHTITFDTARHEALLAAATELGADGRLVREDDGEVRLVTLAEKLLVPLLVKLTNLVPGSGIWLNTQRPEWNDANNALAGYGVSLVTLNAIARYAGFLADTFAEDGEVELSASVRTLLDEVLEALRSIELPVDDRARFGAMERLGRAGEAHREAVYARAFGSAVSTPSALIRELLGETIRLAAATVEASRREDGLYHSYDVLQLDRGEARLGHLAPMLEGQVAVLESGLLDAGASVALLRALRASDLYRPDQHSYVLYPDRPSVPFLQRNTLADVPPIDDPALFVVDRRGAWHFQADLSTLADVEGRLEAIAAPAAAREAVRELWRETFSHREFTGRSDRFFMFEGLGSIYWHMVAKLAVAVQWCLSRADDPETVAALAGIYHDVRDGLGFRKDPALQGAFPTDPYSHTPRHLGAQQPGMTGQVKEQIITRFGELGVEVAEGLVRFAPRLVPAGELLSAPRTATFETADGATHPLELDPGSLVFSYCGVPVVYRLGGSAAVEIEQADGGTTVVDGDRLTPAQSLSLFERDGGIRRLTVTVRRELLDR
ncbi:MAG: hypothetical protein AB1Z67_06210 [Candidatus Limnocylindrales bacterium]